MKTAFWFTLILILFTGQAFSQETNKTIIDERLEREVLLGFCDRDGLKQGEFAEHFEDEYDAYKPGKKVIKKIRKAENDFIIVMILGTWCHDSKIQVPRFYRLLDETGKLDALSKVICVDGNKTGGELSIENYKIEYVPTFIFYRNGKEIGRITESPEKSLEEDFLNIIE